MTTAKNIMTKDVITVAPDDDIIYAVKILLEKKFNGLPVVEDGIVTGILCQSDIIVQQKKLHLPSFFVFFDGIISLGSEKDFKKEVAKITALKVREIMTKNPVTVKSDTLIETIAALIVDNNFHTLPVIDEGVLTGVIGMEDILKTMIHV